MNKMELAPQGGCSADPSAAGVDPATGGDALGAIAEESARQLDRVHHALIGEAVVNDPVLAAASHESTPTQAGEVVRHLRLRELESLNDLADRHLLLRQELKGAKAGRLAEGTEILRDEFGLGWSG